MNKDDQEEEESKEVSKEEVFVEIEDVEYDKENDQILLSANTNIPDKTELSTSARISGSDDILELFTGNAEVKEGKIKTNIAGLEDNKIGKTLIINGTYDLGVSLNINKEREENIDLIETWGEFEDFNKNYETNANAKEWDDSNGYLLEFSFEEALSIDNAIEKEEAEKIYAENSKDSYETLDYNQLIKNPNNHIGEEVKYSGEILEIYESGGITELRLGIDEFGLDAIYVVYYDSTSFVKGDKVTVYGMINGAMTYESVIGAQITIPELSADIIE